MRECLLIVLCLMLCGCATLSNSALPEAAPVLAPTPPVADSGEPTVVEDGAEEQPSALDSKWPPGPKKGDQKDWICLKSGEWLRGEFTSLNRGSVEFDSDEMDQLNLDWDDVHEVITNRTFTLVLSDLTELVGRPRVTRERLYVTNRFGVFEHARSRLMRMIPGRLDVHASWSGSIGFNITARSGNTDQTDFGLHGSAKRRTARGRTTFSVDSLISTTDGSETANNQSFSGRQDMYLSPRFFITPLGVDLYRDRFQNIDLRATPSTGVGYTVVDNGRVEWDGTANLGYRYLVYDSVAAGAEESDGSATLILGTVVDADLTAKVELRFDYQMDVGLESGSKTDHDLGVTLSLDFIWDLELDLRFSWKRIGAPQPDSNGVTPESNDYRVDVGFSWEF